VTLSGRPKQKKFWYKVSVDAIKAWSILITVLGLAVFGVWGNRLLEQRRLEERVVATIAEADRLITQLQREPDLERYLNDYNASRESLKLARQDYSAQRLPEALRNAERSRTIASGALDRVQHKGASGEAHFIATHGNVEFRRGEGGEWEPARSRISLFAGDYIKTSRNGSAEIMSVDGSTFTVRPKTMILIDRKPVAGDARPNRTLALSHGRLRLDTAERGSTIETPGANARVAAKSKASVTYDENTQSGKFANYAGLVEVVGLGGAKVQVGAQEQVTESHGLLGGLQALPGIPRLVSPADNHEIFLERTEKIVLNWRPVKGAEAYSLQISRNHLFADNLIENNRTATSATVGLQKEGTFLWRVAAIGPGNVRGEWSTPRKFRIVPEQETVAQSAADTSLEPQSLAENQAQL
jgi:hypothetical protein